MNKVGIIAAFLRQPEVIRGPKPANDFFSARKAQAVVMSWDMVTGENVVKLERVKA